MPGHALPLEPEKSSIPPSGYFAVSRSATYGFLSALPLILLYEIMIVVANEGAMQQVRVGAEVWMKQALDFLGQTGLFILGIAIIAVGIVVFVADRKRNLPLKASYFVNIVGESTIYAFLVAFGVSTLVGMIFSGLALVEPGIFGQEALSGGVFTNIALSIGAGIYEELLFRVILVGGAFWLLSAAGMDRVVAYLVAAVGGAAIFSAVHYVGVLGDDFTTASFVFRFLFGLALNAIFLLRGFGVAAWTHAIYDILVVTRLLG